MWNRKELKTRAKAVLKTSYWKAFLVSIIILITGGGIRFPSINYEFKKSSSHGFPFIGADSFFSSNLFLVLAALTLIVIMLIVLSLIAFRIFVGYPLEVGGRRYFVQSAQNDTDLNYIGYGFGKGRYIDIVKSMLWRGIFNFLWFLLFIIPGIVKWYSYLMVPYILADNPNIGYRRALKLSMDMTYGEKWRIFIFHLSFIGWYILGMITFGIGTLFVMPYVNASEAEVYLTLRQKALDKGLCTYQELNLDEPSQPEF